jgi:hypothetical protein
LKAGDAANDDDSCKLVEDGRSRVHLYPPTCRHHRLIAAAALSLNRLPSRILKEAKALLDGLVS